MPHEELIALTIIARRVAVEDDTYTGHYMEMRHACFTQTGIDVAALADHLARLSHTL